MKVIKEYENRIDAEMDKGFLESAGIKAFVSGDDEGGFNPFPFTFKIRLSVSDPDEAKALEVLKLVNNAEPVED